ncbi:hypothetical protein FIBSPDRAFT_1054883 [Athelia psychrophila]|uniref:Uncharacterized protein n=1 Tax=Athelia psychrophila TaxID=1759441 RepID=A0A167UNY3_9AGAM|nr:hypothetical protein FIBSPDRAFT_1054883 [Fibularhizoctonia sp. CBS 109695]
MAFPAGSRGFLYLSQVDELQPSWQIRFRVTDSNSPEAFESGTDLLLPDQRPWSVALRALGEVQLAALQKVLARDGLVGDALLSVRPRLQSIQTLDPSRLRPSDYVNFAGAGRPKIKISSQDSFVKFVYHQSVRSQRRHIPFPESANGFLYLHAPKEEPKILWQIRFRVTDNASPASFESGSDLLNPNQIPWFISLQAMKARNSFPALRELLIRDGLDFDSLAEGNATARGPISTPSIYSLGQLFRVDFAVRNLDLRFVGFGADSQLECQVRSPLSAKSRPHRGDNWVQINPYAGSALCCFEAHSSPTCTQPNKLALRIVKMTTPVTTVKPEIAHLIPMPQEGLVMRYTKRPEGLDGILERTLDPRPWTLDTRTTAHPMVQAILHGKTVETT